MGETEILDNTFLQAKQALRNEVRAERRVLSPAEITEKTAALTAQLIALVQGHSARTVTAYVPVRNEPDVIHFANWCREHGVRVLFPSCRADMLLDWVEPDGGGMAPGLFGIPEPSGTVFAPDEALQADLMLIPAAAVDKHGVRLGWGGGFYDRTLGSMEHRPPVFAVVYENEVRDTLPRDVHDIPVNGAVTERAIHRFN